MSEISFGSAGVNNETGIDITQGMIDDVANPFLDLDAIVTQFRFNDYENVTIKIPAGTTVKYGDEQCTLLEDAEATISLITKNGSDNNDSNDSAGGSSDNDSSSSDSFPHATTTSGTVLSGTSLEAEQLITTSGKWTVALGKNVKVRTQDGYVILGSKDPNSLSAGYKVTLSEGSNVYVKHATNITKVASETTKFYFLADVTYHQIVLQELYDTLTALKESVYKSKLLGCLKISNYQEAGRNELTQDEYDALENMSLTEIKDYLSGLKLFSGENGLEDNGSLGGLVGNVSGVDPSEIISIYEKYGVFSNEEIKNLRNNKELDYNEDTDGDLKNKTWGVDDLLGLIYNSTNGEEVVAFTADEINTIRKSAAQNFFESLKNESGITVENIKSALSNLYSVNGNDVNAVCNELKSTVGSDNFTLDKFDKFLKNLNNITLPVSEICAPALLEWVDGTTCVELTDDAKNFFAELKSWGSSLENAGFFKFNSYLTDKLGTNFDGLINKVLSSSKTIKNIYDDIKSEVTDGFPEDLTWLNGVTEPAADVSSVQLTSKAEEYFKELENNTKGDDPLVDYKDLCSLCGNLNVTAGSTIEDCLNNLKTAVKKSKIKLSSINAKLSGIVYASWPSRTSSITTNSEIVKSIIQNKLITLEELREAVKNTGIYDEIDFSNSIEGATSKTEIIKILSEYDEYGEYIKVGDLVEGLTKAHKCSTYLYETALVNEISATGKLNGGILYDYRTTYTDFGGDGNITKLASEKIIEELKKVQRIDYNGFRSGLLSISRFKDGEVDKAIANANANGNGNTAANGNGNTADLQEYIDNMNKLLNLCLLAGTPASGKSEYTLASGVQRTVDSNGNYVYKIIGGGTIKSGAVDASFNKQDATAGMALPYFALAIMYEKTCIQQMILVEQLKQIEKINDEIEENNKALKVLTELYDKVYEAFVWSSNGAELKQDYPNLTYTISLDQYEMSVKELDTYLKEIVKNKIGLGSEGTIDKFADVNANSYMINTSNGGGEFITVVARYDRDGNNMWSEYTKWQKGEKGSNVDHNTSNIDVKEQATLTHISNLQDQVRMYGDSLSTDAQLMTTKMEQYMQDANSCVSACTQTVKSIGDYWKNIVTNIR